MNRAFLILPLLVSGCCVTLDLGSRGPRVIEEPTSTAPPQRRARVVRRAPGSTPAPAKTGHVVIEVFTDFQCPYSRRLHPTLRRIQKHLGKQVTVKLRHSPLPFHDKAVPAAIAALAAERQGKLWEMADQLFLTPGNLAPERYPVLAKKLGLDVARFRRDMSDPALLKRIEADRAEAAKRGARGTPTTFIRGRKGPGGRRIVGAKPFGIVMKHVQEVLSRSQ